MDLALALRAFVRTVERGSLTAAAKDLGVSQPAVTKHLRNLEAYVGARLIERSSRVVRPTALGQTLYATSQSALASIDAAVEGVRRNMGTIEGLLRVHAPTCVGAKHLHPIVMEFQERHPKLSIDLVLEDRVVDLVFENFDLGIKYGRPDGQDLIVRTLGHIRRILVASPGFVSRFGPIDTPEKLSGIDLVTTAAVLSPRNTLCLQHGPELVEVPVRSRLRTNNANVIVNSLLTGRVAGPVQHLLVHDELQSGRLLRILPDYDIKSHDMFMAYPSVRFMRPVVRAFTDFVVPRLKAVDGIDTPGKLSPQRDVTKAEGPELIDGIAAG